MSFDAVQRYLRDHEVDAWLAYDFRGSNPYFQEVLGRHHTTRRAFLLVPAAGEPTLLVHFVDAGRFPEGLVRQDVYVSYQEMLGKLKDGLRGRRRVAMEYSPDCALPAASFADAGTVELVRSLGAEVVSSADLFQYAFARWSDEDLASHRRSAAKLVAIVKRAFAHAGEHLGRIAEHEVAEFIRSGLERDGLYVEDGPIVAVGAHSGDPHYEPSPEHPTTINQRDWVLIDLWACEPGQVSADITWVGYAGREAPARHQEVFAVATAARDLAFARLKEAFAQGKTLEGWQVDQAARDYIAERGYGAYFSHRLGHSLGRRVHGHGVNLDNFETHDTRPVAPGQAFTVEPGIYLPEFGVRTEVDGLMTVEGPIMTTEAQKEIVRIG